MKQQYEHLVFKRLNYKIHQVVDAPEAQSCRAMLSMTDTGLAR